MKVEPKFDSSVFHLLPTMAFGWGWFAWDQWYACQTCRFFYVAWLCFQITIRQNTPNEQQEKGTK